MSQCGPYRLVRRLAVGGMAEVFLADAEERQVVVKRLLPHLEDRPQFVRMFLDEARLISQLDHPNVVQIDGFGEAEGLHYIAMEYVDGLSLGHLLRGIGGQKLPLGLACYVVAEACSGLAYAHDKKDEHGVSLKIVHRDVSPDNILISRRGEVKLADFGIAKASTQIAKTLPGQLKGKLAYMSPEQAMVSPIDHRSDLFSAGIVLYELTVGQMLFDAPNDAKVLNMIVHGDYPPAFPPNYPSELEKVVRRALKKTPEQRFSSAARMRAALLRLIDFATAASSLGELVSRVMPEDEQQHERDVRSTEVVGGTEVGETDAGDGGVDEAEFGPAEGENGLTKPGLGPIKAREDITGPTFLDLVDNEPSDTIKETPAIVREQAYQQSRETELTVDDDAATNKLPAIDVTEPPQKTRPSVQAAPGDCWSGEPVVAPVVDEDDGPSPIQPDELTKSVRWKDSLKEQRIKRLSWIALGSAILILILVILLT